MELNRIDFETRLQSLRAVSLAAESLTRLIRVQALLDYDGSDADSDGSGESGLPDAPAPSPL